MEECRSGCAMLLLTARRWLQCPTANQVPGRQSTPSHRVPPSLNLSIFPSFSRFRWRAVHSPVFFLQHLHFPSRNAEIVHSFQFHDPCRPGLLYSSMFVFACKLCLTCPVLTLLFPMFATPFRRLYPMPSFLPPSTRDVKCDFAVKPAGTTFLNKQSTLLQLTRRTLK